MVRVNWFFFGITVLLYTSSGKILSPQNFEGHLKPFGCCGVKHKVQEVNGFPTAKSFFENNVLNQMPLLMKGGARMSPGYETWSDEYFEKQFGDDIIGVELKKKEHRTMKKLILKVKEYIKRYRTENMYMVSELPVHLWKDVTIPCPLQCKPVMKDRFVETTMWHSNGGTKGSFHIDTVENINCVFRGSKIFTMIDYNKFKHVVNYTEHPYMDVERVNFETFPWMAEVEFYQVNVSAGDCLYIPFSWYHQVNSYNNNIGISTQWKFNLDHDRRTYTECSEKCDPSFTANLVHFMGYDQLDKSPDQTRTALLMLFDSIESIDGEQLRKLTFGAEYEELLRVPKLVRQLDWFMSAIDKNKDGVMTKDEVNQLNEEELAVIGRESNKMTKDIEELQKIIWGHAPGQLLSNEEL